MRRIRQIGAAVILLVAAGLSLKYYLGYRYYYVYGELRGGAKSLESGFTELERALKKAVRFYAEPDFLEDLGGLYFDMGRAADGYGTPEKREARDAYLNMAEEALLRLIRRNPARATGWYELGRVYLFFNFPLLTYREKAGMCIRRAMELSPADEYINVNGLYVLLTQWDSLGEGEREEGGAAAAAAFVRAKIESVRQNNPHFLELVRDMWKENFGDLSRLAGIL